jgi:hypothetical protein
MALTINSTGTTFSGYQGGILTSLGSKVATGSTVNFSGFPSWTKKITVAYSAVQTTGTSGQTNLYLGTASGIETTGYAGTGGFWQSAGNGQVLNGSYSSGFFLDAYTTNTNVRHGLYTLINLSGNTWVLGGFGATSEVVSLATANGTKTLSGVLTQIQFGIYGGAGTFSTGNFVAYYE